MPLVDVAVDLISPCKVMVGGKDLPIKALTGFINICTTPYDYPHWQCYQWVSCHVIFLQFAQELLEWSTIKDLVNLQLLPLKHRSSHWDWASANNSQELASGCHLQVLSWDHQELLIHNLPLQSSSGCWWCDWYFQSTIALIVFAFRVAVHQTFGGLPGGLAFQCGMLNPIPILANFESIHQPRQTIINHKAHWWSPASTHRGLLQSHWSPTVSSWSVYCQTCPRESDLYNWAYRYIYRPNYGIATC